MEGDGVSLVLGADSVFPGGGVVPYKPCFKQSGHWMHLVLYAAQTGVTAGGSNPGAGDTWNPSQPWAGRSICMLCCEGEHSLRQRRSAEMSTSQI